MSSGHLLEPAKDTSISYRKDFENRYDKSFSTYGKVVYLSHGGQKPLGIEETRHPKYIWPTIVYPFSKLIVSFQ